MTKEWLVYYLLSSYRRNMSISTIICNSSYTIIAATGNLIFQQGTARPYTLAVGTTGLFWDIKKRLFTLFVVWLWFNIQIFKKDLEIVLTFWSCSIYLIYLIIWCFLIVSFSMPHNILLEIKVSDSKNNWISFVWFNQSYRYFLSEIY